MLKTVKIILFLSMATLFSKPAFAKSCDVEYFYSLCPGCTMNLKWKMQRADKSQYLRWCTFGFGDSTTAKLGFQVVKGFSLGEMRTGYDKITVSPLKTGRDKIIVKFHGVHPYNNKCYVSTINFDVEVVEGSF